MPSIMSIKDPKKPSNEISRQRAGEKPPLPF